MPAQHAFRGCRFETGATRPHRPDDYITKVTAVPPGGKCERFLKFLEEITGGDADLQAYLQRVFGYALTGCTREHALFFGYGTGANGKSVLLITISGIMGSYHEVAPIETFTISNMDRHPTELAGLVGARLVSATETEEGRRWAESRVKQLTGGDAISARFIRRDFFKYLPAFKLFITGNHKPSLRSVDEAMRRRFHLIPFSVTIPSEQRDDRLSELLKAEWPGILQWVIDGCVKWQKGDLQPPKAVRDATEEYLVPEDAIGAWLEERCKRVVTAWTGSTELFVSWRAWAEQNGETAGTSKALTTALVKRGFVYVRRNTGKGFSGIRVTHEGVGYDD
jgi:putative DNA primase/helicase